MSLTNSETSNSLVNITFYSGIKMLSYSRSSVGPLVLEVRLIKLKVTRSDVFPRVFWSVISPGCLRRVQSVGSTGKF